MNQIVTDVEKKYKKKNPPNPQPGDTVRVYQKIVEGDKKRIQIFEGLVISRKHGNELGASYTVRKIAAAGIGVERTFPIHSPNIIKVERAKSAPVRRAKLYYLRDRVGSVLKLRKEKANLKVWEEPAAEEELEKIKEEQEKLALEKQEEKAEEAKEIEEKLEEVQKVHEAISDSTQDK